MKKKSRKTSCHTVTNLLDRIVAILGLLVLGIAAAAPPDGFTFLKIALAGVAFGAACLSMTGGKGSGAPVALVAGFLSLARATGMRWQFAVPLALLAYFVTAKRTQGLPERSWWSPGRIPWRTTIFCAILTPAGLLAWVSLFSPNIDDLLRAVPDIPLPFLLAGAAAFTLMNAIGEELIWRGLFQDRLVLLFGPAAGIILQAASFGAQHAHGFPRGLTGEILAGIWGLMLGWLRLNSGGILGPIIVHVAADATIAAILLSLAHR